MEKRHLLCGYLECGATLKGKVTEVIKHYATHDITPQNNELFKDFLLCLVDSNSRNELTIPLTCFVCGKENLLSQFLMKKHLIECHPYLGFSKSNFDEKVVKNLVSYTERDIDSPTGKATLKSYNVKAGKTTQKGINWKSSDAYHVFIAVAKKCVDWMRYQGGNEDVDIYTNLLFGYSNYYQHDGTQVGGSDESFYTRTSENSVGTTVKRNKGLFDEDLNKIKNSVFSRVLTPGSNDKGSEWGFYQFEYFNLTSSNVGRGDKSFTKIVSGDGDSDEEQKAFEFRKRKEPPDIKESYKAAKSKIQNKAVPSARVRRNLFNDFVEEDCDLSDDVGDSGDEDIVELTEIEKDEIQNHADFIDNESVGEETSLLYRNVDLLAEIEDNDLLSNEQENYCNDFSDIENDLSSDFVAELKKADEERKNKNYNLIDEDVLLENIRKSHNIKEFNYEKIYADLSKKIIFGKVEEAGECFLKALEVGVCYSMTNKVKHDVKHDELGSIIGDDLAKDILSLRDDLTFINGKIMLVSNMRKLNAMLRQYGIVVSYSILRKKYRLQYSVDFTREDLQNEYQRNKKTKRFSVSTLENVFNGLLESQYQEDHLRHKNAEIKHHIYLVAQECDNSMKVGFVTNIAEFYKTYDDDCRKNKKGATQNSHLLSKVNGICPKCHALYKRKCAFQNHVKTCRGFANTIFKFTDLHDFSDDLSKLQTDPFSLMLDLEIDSTKGDILSYGIGVFFQPNISYPNSEVKPDENYNSLYVVRIAPSQLRIETDRKGLEQELSEYPFPDFILPIILQNEDKLKVLQKRIQSVIEGKPNAFKELLFFDLSYLYFAFEAHFAKIRRLNNVLKPHVIQNYRSKHPPEGSDCYICGFPIKDGTEVDCPNPEYCKHLLRAEFIRQYQASQNFKIDEEEFVSKCYQGLRNLYKLRHFKVIDEEEVDGLNDDDFPQVVLDYASLCKFESVNALVGEICTFKGGHFSQKLINFEFCRLFSNPGFKLSDDFQDDISSAFDNTCHLHHDHYVTDETKTVLGWTHRSCNSKVRNNCNRKIPANVYAHNIGGLDLNAIFSGLNLSDWDSCNFKFRGESVNTLKGLRINQVQFTDSYGFFDQSLDEIGQSLTVVEKERVRNDMRFTLERSSRFKDKYSNLPSKIREEILEFSLKKGILPYEFLKSVKVLNMTSFPSMICFTSVLKAKMRVEKSDYDNTKFVFDNLCKDLSDLVAWYQLLDVVLLGVVVENRIHIMTNEYHISAHRFSSMATFSKAQLFRSMDENYVRPVVGGVQNDENRIFFDRASFGGFAATPVRLGFSTAFLFDDGKVTQPIQEFLVNTAESPEIPVKVKGRMVTCLESFDEHGQYGNQMKDHLMPIGCVRDVILDPPTNVDLTEWFLQNEELHGTSKIGYIMEVFLKMPTEGIGLTLLTEYSPLFSRKKVDPHELSILQLTQLKTETVSSKKHEKAQEEYKKISSSQKTVFSLEDQVAVVFGKTLLYLVKVCGVKIKCFIKAKTFLQKNWMHHHIFELSEKRKVAVAQKDDVKSKTFKGMINKVFGSTMVGGNATKKEVVPVIDPFREFDQWSEEKTDYYQNVQNPYASVKTLLQLKKSEIDETIHSVENSDESDIIKQTLIQNAQESLVEYEEKLQYAPKKRKFQQKFLHSDDKFIEMSKDPKFASITQLKQSASIKGFGSRQKVHSNYTLSYVGCVVMAGAKLSICHFIHSLIKVFDVRTRTSRVQREMDENQIIDIYVKLHVTDTDSAKPGFYSIVNEQCKMTDAELSLWIRQTVVREMQKLIDRSSKYFQKWDLHDEKTKKQYGLFGFEDYGDKTSTIDVPVQLMLAVAPKNYTQIAVSNSVPTENHAPHSSLTHKGISKHQTGCMTPIVYAEQIKPLHLLERYVKAPVRKVDQARFHKQEGTATLAIIRKNLHTKIPDKSFIFSDGSMSIPHGHPLLKKYVYAQRKDTSQKELLQKKRIGFELKIERKVIRELKWAYNNEKFLNTILSNSKTVYETVLKKAQDLS